MGASTHVNEVFCILSPGMVVQTHHPQKQRRHPPKLRAPRHHPPSEAHLGLFGGKKKSQNKNFDDHITHYTLHIITTI